MDETTEQRSRIMRAVRSKDTTPELIVRKISFSLGYRHRLHREDLPGKPDLVYPSKKKVIFVNGCFWHGHDCKRGARVPKTNREYWRNKIQRNIDRDQKTIKSLVQLGWNVFVIWECETKDIDLLAQKIDNFLSDI